MLDWGYLQRDDATGFYSLGLEIVALAGAALQNSSIYRFAYPELQRLSYKYGVHSHMSVPRGVEVVPFDQYLLRKYHGIADSDGSLPSHVLFRHGTRHYGVPVLWGSSAGLTRQRSQEIYAGD